MKKIFLIASALLLATTAQASYLYWQVLDTDYANADIFGGDADVVKSAKVTYSNGTASNPYQAYDVAGTIKYIDDNAYVADAAVAVPNSNVYMLEGDFNSGYTYYIELYNSTGTLVSRSAGMTGAQLSSDKYIYANAVDVSSGLNPADVAKVWHGGGAYSAVPEPTSAILMLFGAAMLGLKRKNRSIA